jgi:phospholipid-binding lipoprotein MlaA
MSISAFATAVLLAGAPAEAGDVPAATTAAVSHETPPAPASTPAPSPPAPETESAAPSQDAAQPAASDADGIEQSAIIVTANPPPDPGDPIQQVNTAAFEVTQAVDDAFVAPVSLSYKRTLPKPVRTGLRNFLGNLQEPVVFLNFLIQLKPGKAFETLGRFTVNSTIGVGGLIDVAKKRPFNLPRRRNGFAYSLGYYGVKPGPYLFLPLIGPTTVRDLFGRWLDLLVLPLAIGKPFNRPVWAASTFVVSSLDDRAESDEKLRALREGTTDPYEAVRDSYLRERQAEIDKLRGKVSNSAPLAPAEPATPSAAPPSSEPPEVTSLSSAAPDVITFPLTVCSGC